jgi:hypothetical protein
VAAAETTNATVVRLGESSAEISNVVKVTTAIAEHRRRRGRDRRITEIISRINDYQSAIAAAVDGQSSPVAR